jgi:hypothetical protein
MSYLVDTNVLLRSVQKSHPMESETRYDGITVVSPSSVN